MDAVEYWEAMEASEKLGLDSVRGLPGRAAENGEHSKALGTSFARRWLFELIFELEGLSESDPGRKSTFGT